MERALRPEAADNWKGLLLFFSANILFSAGLFSHAFLYNFYLDGLGHSETIMGLAAALLTAGGLVALFPAGIMVDRIGSRFSFLVAALIAAAGLTAGAFAVRPSLIYAAAFLVGGGTAMWRVAMGPIIMQLTSPASRSRAFSWNVALLVGSGALWTAISGAIPGRAETMLGLTSVDGIRAALLLGAVGTLLSTAVFASSGPMTFGPARPKQRGERRDAAVGSVLRDLKIPMALFILVMLVALWMSASGLVIPFFNIYFLREHGLSVNRIGLIFALAQALTAVVIFGSGEVASRLGVRRTLAAWMLIFAPALWALALVDAVGVAMALYLIQGLVPPATNPLIDQILLERAPEDRRGAVSSWRNGATDGSGFVGASFGGVILESGSFDLLFGVAGGLGLLGAVSLIVALRRLSDR